MYDTYLVIMAGTLAVLGECLQALVDELCIVSIDVEAEEHQASSGHSADTVQETKCFQNEVVAVFTIILLP